MPRTDPAHRYLFLSGRASMPRDHRRDSVSTKLLHEAMSKSSPTSLASLRLPPTTLQAVRIQPSPSKRRGTRMLMIVHLFSGPADFFPWTGNHAEDILTEQTTKTGFYEKTPVGQNETNSAKPSISTSLKHKSGLQILSSLFVSALDRRRAHGTVTANSTFKPPPRVTLTDTKREAWLRDLADPTIPLRRLSRTIPHGIRGKVLLDHCLHKDIPTGRAVWLAKCVGANEIRAFKRKGASGAFAVGGEAKWIREWTSHVEQFVESTIDSCGTANWKDLISYA